MADLTKTRGIRGVAGWGLAGGCILDDPSSNASAVSAEPSDSRGSRFEARIDFCLGIPGLSWTQSSHWPLPLSWFLPRFTRYFRPTLPTVKSNGSKASWEAGQNWHCPGAHWNRKRMWNTFSFENSSRKAFGKALLKWSHDRVLGVVEPIMVLYSALLVVGLADISRLNFIIIWDQIPMVFPWDSQGIHCDSGGLELPQKTGC